MESAERYGPEEIRRAFFSALAALEHNYDILDNLNVFPVPDGDTGTNMLSTFEAGVRVLNNPALRTVGDMAEQMNREMIRESRGNSGFITARFFHGFFESACRGGAEGFGPGELAAGFSGGLFQVNRSLFSPAEGTMLTIIRVMAESMQAAGGKGEIGAAGMLEEALEAAGAALFDTPRLLPVLARAGVVDSGALGFIILMKGFLQGLKPPQAGQPAVPPERENEADYRFPPRSSIADPGSAGAGQPAGEPAYGYCTEVNVRTRPGFSLPDLTAYLKERGGSIALVHEDDFLKVHIHTGDPAEIIARLKTVGTVEHVKIDNMTEQVSRYSAAHPDAGGGDGTGEGSAAVERGKCAVLAFAPGEGFREVFSTLEVSHCIVYGEKLPAAGEILACLEEVPESEIIVLPNNGNILPAVTAAAEKSAKRISVLHTTDIVRGIAAAYGYSRNDGLEENAANMRECMEMARGIFVYRGVAESRFDDRLIAAGDYFAVMGGGVCAAGPDLQILLAECIAAGGEAANITLYYGPDELLPELTAFRDTYTFWNGDVEMELIRGGQSRESIIISME